MEEKNPRVPIEVRDYLASIGRVGGQRSKRNLSREESKNMVRIREARRAFRKYYAQCFWSYDRNLKININDVPWVVEMLKRHGNRKAWETATSLCR